MAHSCAHVRGPGMQIYGYRCACINRIEPRRASRPPRDIHIHLYIYIYMCVYIYVYVYIHLNISPPDPTAARLRRAELGGRRRFKRQDLGDVSNFRSRNSAPIACGMPWARRRRTHARTHAGIGWESAAAIESFLDKSASIKVRLVGYPSSTSQVPLRMPI